LHRTRCGRATRPAKPVGALVVTLEQGVARSRKAGLRIDGEVAHTKGEGVDVECVRELIQGRFQREMRKRS
jgi:hypothetical protein